MDAPTMIEMAVIATQATFMKYAASQDKDATISRGEFKKLVKEEMPYLEGCPDMEKMFDEFDQDKSEGLDFNEFCSIIFSLAACSYEHLQQLMTQKGDKVKA